MLVHIQDLVKTYATPEGARHVVLDVPEFSMETGEQVALEGRSGTGKTTLLNVLAGILRADVGKVEVAGVDLAGLSEPARDRFRAGNLGYVFQTFNLLQGYTALENVLLGMVFGPGPDAGHAASLLEELGLGDRMHHRPRQLSLGQQQRVAVARALANRPRLVLADEPTGSLDEYHAGEALDLLRETCAEHGASLLIVSHDREVLGHFDRVVALSGINRAVASAMTGETPGEAMP